MKDLEEKAGLLSRSAFPLLHLFGLQHVGVAESIAENLSLVMVAWKTCKLRGSLWGWYVAWGISNAWIQGGLQKEKKIKAMG